MDIPSLRRFLDDPGAAGPWLRSLGVADLKQAHAHLLAMAASGLTLDLLAVICEQLVQALARLRRSRTWR